MTQVRHIVAAAIVGSLAAGPAFVGAVLIGALLDGRAIAVDPQFAAAPIALIPVAAVGWFLAIGPNLLGTMAMGLLGRSNEGARLPVMWALAGAAAGGIPVGVLSSQTGGTGPAAAMAAAGAASALLCRSRVRWVDGVD